MLHGNREYERKMHKEGEIVKGWEKLGVDDKQSSNVQSDPA